MNRWFAAAKARSLSKRRGSFDRTAAAADAEQPAPTVGTSSSSSSSSSSSFVVTSSSLVAVGVDSAADGFESSAGFSSNECFGANGGFEQDSVIHHAAFAVASADASAADGDGFGASDGFGSDAGLGHTDIFTPAFAWSSNPDPAVADALAPFRGKNLKVKRSSGAIEGGWQLAAGAQVDASGMVELVMGELSRTTWLNELMQLNTELLLEQARMEQFEMSGAAQDVGFGPSDGFGDCGAAADTGGDGFGANDGFGGNEGFGAADGFGDVNIDHALAFASSSSPEPAVADALAPFRGKNLKVKRSSGAIEGGWQLAAGAQVDASGMVELVMGELSRATSLNELVQLNTEMLAQAHLDDPAYPPPRKNQYFMATPSHKKVPLSPACSDDDL